MGIIKPLVARERSCWREQSGAGGAKRVLCGHIRRKLSRRWNVGQRRGDQLSNIRPRALDVLGQLSYCGPVIKNDAECPVNHGILGGFVGEAKAWPKVGVNVVVDLARLAHDHMSRQRTVPRNARCKTAHVARRWQLLNDVIAGREVHIAGLRPTVLADCCARPIGRQERVVVAQPKVDGELSCSLP